MRASCAPRSPCSPVLINGSDGSGLRRLPSRWCQTLGLHRPTMAAEMYDAMPGPPFLAPVCPVIVLRKLERPVTRCSQYGNYHAMNYVFHPSTECAQ